LKSGNPDPIDDLKLIIDTKRHSPNQTVDVVSDATRWIKAALEGAGIAYTYACCDMEEPFGFAAFTILRSYRREHVVLDLKVAEIKGRPFVFAEIRTTGKLAGTLFPFFGNLRSDEDRDNLLHYIADFMLSSEAK
jgi:hypothetical protein